MYLNDVKFILTNILEHLKTHLNYYFFSKIKVILSSELSPLEALKTLSVPFSIRGVIMNEDSLLDEEELYKL